MASGKVQTMDICMILGGNMDSRHQPGSQDIRTTDPNMALGNGMDHGHPHGTRASSWPGASVQIFDASMASGGSSDHGGLSKSSTLGNEVFFIVDFLFRARALSLCKLQAAA
uniref:Uncharacterized protein n=1 Tax=Mus musculus TaxID=10090 RepID=Q3UV41_MOUSE|nr:unnamed protein product [Mus musculus]